MSDLKPSMKTAELTSLLKYLDKGADLTIHLKIGGVLYETRDAIRLWRNEKESLIIIEGANDQK